MHTICFIDKLFTYKKPILSAFTLLHLVARPLCINKKNGHFHLIAFRQTFPMHFVKHFVKQISQGMGHYQHNNVLKCKNFSWHKEVFREKNVNHEKRVYE